MEGDGREHLAVGMARAAGLAVRGEPRVQVLKNHKKSMVFRVIGADRSLIAKRAYSSTLATERYLYAHLLPSLPGSHIRLLGSVEDADPRFHWLFLEDAGETVYDGSSPAERLALGRILGTLHASTKTTERHSPIPVRTSDDYLSTVSAARARIAAATRTEGLAQSVVEMLEAIVAHLNTIERHWESIAAAVRAGGTVLTHGDVQPKNVRVVPGEDGSPGILLLDWETAAWDSPAIDLQTATLDDPLLRGYMEASDLEANEESRLLDLSSHGRVLRLIHTVDWGSWDLASAYPQPSIDAFTVYRRRLDAALEHIGIHSGGG